ncbi:hypothetical protein M9H77_08569 [Catharanthus roseus]|uniref:Uncharacterized protein n=1 Tax=Catharanthus roseus TaxID=4058 RepID=A0ACC0BYB8_CATRO|nr:hypothetical protein M9H77_08569 [Catharanthus roseus]
MLDQISTGPILKFRECRSLIKGVLCSVLPEDPGAPLTSPPEHAVMKGRRKTNSTKRDKSYWEQVSIEHRKIGKSSGSGSSSGSGFGSGSGSSSHGRGRPPRAPRGRSRGRSSGQSSLSSGINPSTPSTFPYIDAFSGFIYEFIQNWKNVVGDGIGSTTLLLLYSNSTSPAGILCIDGYPLTPLHVQWQYHRDIQVSGWPEPYYERIADWVRRHRAEVPPRDPIYVISISVDL